MKRQIAHLRMFKDSREHTIAVYRCDIGMPYEVRLDGRLWHNCDTRSEVDAEIGEMISMYDYSYVPAE